MKNLALPALIFAGLCIPSMTNAFDAGPHNYLTICATRDEGFSIDAQNVAALDNNLVDYYTSQPTYPGLNEELNYAHFDYRAAAGVTLPNPFDHVKNYWQRLAFNTREYVQMEAKSSDPNKVSNILHVIGYTLHTLQDFYAHSTWVECLPESMKGPGFLPSATFFDMPVAQLNSNLRTGKYPNTKPEPLATDHGETGVGINHDYSTRPNFLMAYSTAYAGSRQWIRAITTWVRNSGPEGPGIVTQLKATALDATDRDHVLTQLNAYHQAANYLGHWDGPASHRIPKMVVAMAAMASSPESSCSLTIKTHLYNQILKQNVDSFGKRNRAIDPHMVGGGPLTDAQVPIVPKLTLNVRMVQLRTTAVSSNFSAAEKINTFVGVDAGYDEWSKVTIGGHSFESSSSGGSGTFNPDWTAIDFIPSTRASTDIDYSIHQFGGTECHVNPYGPKNIHFRFSFLADSCIGPTVIGATQSQPFTANGQSYRYGALKDHLVNATFYVKSDPLGSVLPPPNQPIPAAIPAPVDYSVSFHTGDIQGAGTDSNITVTLHGARGTIGPYVVNPWITGNAFERNQTDTIFFQQFPDIGKVTSISVTSDDKYPGSDWYLDWIKVQASGQPQGYYGYHNWIKAGNLSANVGQSAAPTDYKVTVYTGDKVGAGTDSNISIVIQGSKGQTPAITLNPFISGNAFERNQTDIAQIASQFDVGDIQSVTITSDDKYAGSAWYLGWIEIRATSGSVKRFNYNNWVQKGNLTVTLR